MDKKERYINYVVDDLVKKTEINHETERIKTPFRQLSYSFILHFQLPTGSASSTSVLYSSFSKHCEEVYGLYKDEVDYIWDRYIQIFRDKINNG